MKISTFAKTAVMAGIVTAALWGQPQMAHAEESSTRGEGGGVISDLAARPSTSAATDDVWIEGKIITAENYDPVASDDDVVVDGRIITAEGYAPEAEPTAGTRTDSEWKYVPIRRTAGSETDTTDSTPDILYDPDDDVLPPVKPVSDEEPTPVIDEMTQDSAETEVVRIPITIKHGA